MFLLIALNKRKNTIYAFGIILSLMLSSTSLNFEFGNLIGANSFNSIKHAPFDGTVYPYSSTVDWVNLTESERKMSFSEIPSSKKLPPLLYDPSDLALPIADLGFTSKKDLEIRNAKITYSVPYLGNYELDGVEGAGSHPAVDIKLPKGTPVLAIMNGVVIKAEDQPWGFGKHIVVRHNDVPSLTDKSALTTYYSSYSHLSSINTEAGTVVNKGEVIGYSGDSGTATTPHLHFQIDTVDAPWYPYWPFSINEAESAGMSVFDAVNAGLGISEAKRLTINPVKYVQKYFDGTKPQSVKEEVEDESESVREYVEETTEKEPTEEPTTTPVDEKGPTVVIDSTISDEVSLNVSPVILLGQPSNLELSVGNSLSNQFASGSYDDINLTSNLKISSSIPVVANSDSRKLLIPFTPKEIGYMNMKVVINGEAISTGNVEVRTFADISPTDNDNYRFLYLKNNGVISGDSEGNLNPEAALNRAQAVKVIIESLKGQRFEVVRSEPDFKDIDSSDWFADYVSKAFRYGFVNGKTATNFEPNSSIKLAEFLKMYFTALKIDIDPVVHDSYSTYFDTSAWYAKYLVEAINRNLIDAEFARNPDRALTKRHVAQIVYKIMKIAEAGQDKYQY